MYISFVFIDFKLSSSYFIWLLWKSDRVAEGARLEIVCTVNAVPRVQIPALPLYCVRQLTDFEEQALNAFELAL